MPEPLSFILTDNMPFPLVSCIVISILLSVLPSKADKELSNIFNIICLNLLLSHSIKYSLSLITL